MAVLSQLAQTKQQTRVGGSQVGTSSMASVGQVKATKQIDNTAPLLGDIQKLIGKSVEIKSSVSKYSGERVGIDAMMSYKKDLADIDAEYAKNPNLTVADMLAKSNAQQGLYDYYMSKGVFTDNDEANNAFKETFARPATGLLQKNKVYNVAKATEIHKVSEKKEVTKIIDTIGVDINKDMYNSLMKRWVDSGNDSFEYKKVILGSINDGIEADVRSNPDKYFNAAGKVDKDKIKAELDKRFSHISGDDSATVQAYLSKNRRLVESAIDAEANKKNAEYVNSASIFAKSLRYTGSPYTDDNGVQHRLASEKEYDKLVRENFPLLSKDEHTKLMNLYKEETSTTSMSGIISLWQKDVAGLKTFTDNGKLHNNDSWTKLKSQGIALSNSENITGNQKASIANTIRTIEDGQKRVRETMGKFEVSNIEYGTRIYHNGFTSTDSEGKPITYTSSDVQKVLDNSTAQIAENIKRLDASDTTSFKNSMALADRYRIIQGRSKSDIDVYFDSSLKYTNGDMSRNQIGLLANFMDYKKSTGDDSYAYLRERMTDISSVLAKEVDEKDKPKQLAQANRMFRSMIRDRDLLKSRHNIAFKTIMKEITNVAEGGNLFDITSIYMDAPSMANDILRGYHGNMDELSVQEYASKFARVDFGTYFGFDKRGAFAPKDVTAGEVYYSLEKIMDTYNEGRTEKINANDIIPVTDSNDEEGYHLLIKVGNEVIGKITKGSFTSFKLNEAIKRPFKTARQKTENAYSGRLGGYR